jgi:hypothetical protein
MLSTDGRIDGQTDHSHKVASLCFRYLISEYDVIRFQSWFVKSITLLYSCGVDPTVSDFLRTKNNMGFCARNYLVKEWYAQKIHFRVQLNCNIHLSPEHNIALGFNR